MTEVLEKLKEIGTNGKEVDLFPVLQKLFLVKGYETAEITHGPNEFGKDLVLKVYDQLEGSEKWTSVVVKNRKASNRDFEEGGEIRRQIHTSFNQPYEFGGKIRYINSVIVVINGSVSNQASKILLTGTDNRQYVNVTFWNRDRLGQEIERYIREEFLGEHEIKINSFILRQVENFKKLDDSKKLFGNLPFDTIDSLFVAVRTSYTSMKLEERKYQFKPKKSFRRKKELDDVKLILKSGKNCIIHGIPTSGKTLLLKRIGISALEMKKKNAVFYIKVASYLGDDDILIEKVIADRFEKVTEGGEFIAKEFDKVILLIDGIEETTDKEKLERFFENVTAFKDDCEKQENDLQIIIASRTVDVFEGLDRFVDYEQIELFPFNIGQAMALARKILPANNERKAKNLIQALKSKQLSSSLIRTPMAITLMAILYRDDEIDMEELPANITELYNKFTDYYLNRWDITKGVSLQYKYEELRNILAIIARYLHKEGISHVYEDELISLLQDTSKDFSYDELEDVTGFVEKLKSSVQVIVYDKDHSCFSFINHSFQEYFASIFYDDSSESELLDNYFNETWEQSIVFYNGKAPKRDVFLKKVIDGIVPVNLRQEYQYLLLTSRSLQAANLIGRRSQKSIIKDLIGRLNKFYKNLLKHNYETKSGTAAVVNPILFVWNFRIFFEKMFATKHIHIDDLEEVAAEFIAGDNAENTEDAIKYILGRHLAFKRRSSAYLKLIDEIVENNMIWQRFLYVDHKLLDDKSVDEDYLKRLERKQRKNQSQIVEMFEKPAIEVLYRSPDTESEEE